LDPHNGFGLDTKATLFLLTGKMDDAYRTYDFVLSKDPGHLLSLMGKARVLYIRNQYRAALKLYQSVLSAAPDFLPDPRIGIGLCFWNLGEHNIARRAWERSQTVNPGKASTGATLLLGLSWLNVARDPKLDEEDKIEFYTRGIQQVQAAWAQDKTCAATAAALSGYFLTSANKWDTVIKLAELAVQHGDSRAVISDGHLAIARALHAQDKADEATRHYALAMEANPNSTVAALAMGQMHVQIQDWPAAVNAYDAVLRKQPRSIEAMVSMASVYSHAVFTDTPISAEKQEDDLKKARDLFDQVVGLFQGTAHLKDGLGDRHSLDPLGTRIQQIATNSDLYVEIARLCMEDDMAKSLQAYRQGLGVWRDANNEQDGVNQASLDASQNSIGPQLLCNIGCLEYSRGDFESAQERFEEAITTDLERQQALQEIGGSREGDATMMTLMYNLGIVMEARGQKEEAKQLYEGRLLARHPEFIEGWFLLALDEYQCARY
jgi:RNA polymerase-associated protein CTR9